MRPQTFISGLYGELRGYRRLQIRRRVAANERLSPGELSGLGERLFQQHVRRSIDLFPFYAARVKAHRGVLPAPGEYLHSEELPIWTRHDQIEFFRQQERPPDSHYVHSTGGSTGQVVRFHITRESYEWRTAIMDRAYGWAGAEEGARSVHIWGTGGVEKPWPHQLKHTVHVTLQGRTYFDVSREFTDANRASCCDLINRIRPEAIVGYAGMLVDLARYTREHGGLRWKTPSLISTAETMQCGQRELLQAHLAREVFDSYGSREFMNIGTECARHRGYHINTDSLRVEVVDDDGLPVALGVEGRIIITDFRNAATPFIRYEVGDRGVLADPNEACPCGRPFPRLLRVEGRLQDIIYTPNGLVSALSVEDVLEHFDWVEGYQLVQPSRERLVIRLLTRINLTHDQVAPIVAILRPQLGDTVVEFERVGELSRRPNGKIDLVISSVRDAA
jgi:phenylacetate-CoA ligase